MANNWTLQNKRLFMSQVDDGKTLDWQAWYWNVSREQVRQRRKAIKRWLEHYESTYRLRLSKLEQSGCAHG